MLARLFGWGKNEAEKSADLEVVVPVNLPATTAVVTQALTINDNKAAKPLAPVTPPNTPIDTSTELDALKILQNSLTELKTKFQKDLETWKKKEIEIFGGPILLASKEKIS